MEQQLQATVEAMRRHGMHVGQPIRTRLRIRGIAQLSQLITVFVNQARPASPAEPA